MTGDISSFALICCLVFGYFLFFPGSVIQAIEYDYSATLKCLEEPWDVQYKGGVISNPDFIDGIDGWAAFGNGCISVGKTKGGNNFIVASNRKHPTDGFSYKVKLQKGMLYALSGWVQVSEGSEVVGVAFRTPGGEMLYGGGITAQHGCWSMLKGGIVSNFTGTADLVFESNNTAVEIWADNIALQPFTEEEWTSHQDKAIEKARKGIVNFDTRFTNKTKLNGAKIIIKQTKPNFLFGTVINNQIINNAAYQNWVNSRFTVVTFANEMKWYTNERVQGQEDYSAADAMMRYAEQNKIVVRGHNVLWDDPSMQPSWVYSLPQDQLNAAVQRRIRSVVGRYAGRLIHWDVVNENMHFSYFEDKLGESASGVAYGEAQRIDPISLKFLNEFNTIEEREDPKANPYMYEMKMKNVIAYSGLAKENLGIGLQTRYRSRPNLVVMRAGLDYLAETGCQIWLTEVFVNQTAHQAKYLEQVLREGHAYPAVGGIVMWPSSPLVGKCEMCLTDASFRNTPNGNVVDELVKRWRQSEISFQCDGSCSIPLYHGEYRATVLHPEANLNTTLNLKVAGEGAANSLHVEVDPHSAKITQM